MKTTQKYKDIIDTAQKLFFKYGMKRVSVEEICAETKVSKMTFYKYFPNKQELTKTVLDQLFTSTLNIYGEIIKADTPFAEKINQFVELKWKRSQDTSKEFLIELYKNPDTEFKNYIDKWIRKSYKFSIDFLVDAQKKGLIRADIKPEFLLTVLEKTADICSDEAMIKLYDNKLSDLMLEVSKMFLYGIFEER